MDKGLAADSEKRSSICSYKAPGGGTKGVALRGSLPRVPPPPRAAPGVGHAAPRPPGLRPLCAHAHGHPLSADQKGEGALGCFGWKFSKKRRRPGQLEGGQIEDLSTRKASVSSPDNSRTRRAVHTLVVWAGELSRRGKGRAYALLSTAFEEINRLVRYRVLAPRVVTQNCAA